MAGGTRGVSSCTLFKELSWETLSQRRENRRILMFSDIVHHRSPTYLQDLLPGSVESRSGHRYNLRNSDLMDTFSCRTETFKSSFFPYSTIFWNNLDENLKAIDERSILKSNLAKKRVNKNKYYLLGPRTTNIILARLRMGCSELRVHLNCLHFSESTKCCCGEVETTEHFFLSCTLYTAARNELEDLMNGLGLIFNCTVILHGSEDHNNLVNTNLMAAVDTFLRSSNRFSLLNR